MKRLHSNQQGIGFVLVLVALVVVGALAVIGLRVTQHDVETNDDGALSSQVKVPKTVKSSADVQKASQALDNTSVDSSVNSSQLDGDLNSLL